MLGNESYGDEYFDMLTLMHANLSRFAAYKAYHATQELKDISPKDIDRRGRLVLNKYNRVAGYRIQHRRSTGENGEAVS